MFNFIATTLLKGLTDPQTLYDATLLCLNYMPKKAVTILAAGLLSRVALNRTQPKELLDRIAVISISVGFGWAATEMAHQIGRRLWERRVAEWNQNSLPTDDIVNFTSAALDNIDLDNLDDDLNNVEGDLKGSISDDQSILNESINVNTFIGPKERRRRIQAYKEYSNELRRVEKELRDRFFKNVNNESTNNDVAEIEKREKEFAGELVIETKKLKDEFDKKYNWKLSQDW